MWLDGSAFFGVFFRMFSSEISADVWGRPGVLVDRFGSSAVVTFEVVGSAKLEVLVQDGSTLGKLGGDD